MGRIAVALRKLIRPLLRAPLGDLFERQRVFNLLQLEEQIRTRRRLADSEQRLAGIEALVREGLDEICRYNDALYSRVDAKLDRLTRDARSWQARLQDAFEPVEADSERPTSHSKDDAGDAESRLRRLAVIERDARYTSFEDRFRGPREEIAERLQPYVEILSGQGPVLDLGCGRGELLELLARNGTKARGVDGNLEMVRQCRQAQLDVEQGDLLQELARVPSGQLGAICAFHVIEHLDAEQRLQLVRSASAALRPGGLLVLETPSPLSIVSGSDFWIDVTHRRPAHPRQLEALAIGAGFESVELRFLQPFPEDQRLSEIELDGLDGQARALADRMNRLRDEIDEILYGYRDVAVIARKPERQEA